MPDGGYPYPGRWLKIGGGRWLSRADRAAVPYVQALAISRLWRNSACRIEQLVDDAIATNMAVILDGVIDGDVQIIAAVSLPVPYRLSSSRTGNLAWIEAHELIWVHLDPDSLPDFLRAYVCPRQVRMINNVLQSDLLFTVTEAGSEMQGVLEEHRWTHMEPCDALIRHRVQKGAVFSPRDTWLRAPRGSC